MTRQQLITAGTVILVLAGVWLSSRETTLPKPKPTDALLPAAAISSTLELPTPTAGPILLAAPVIPTLPTLGAVALAPNVVTPISAPPTAQPTEVIIPAAPSTEVPPTPIPTLPAPSIVEPTAPPTPITTYQLPSPTANLQSPISPDVAAAEQSMIDQVNYQRSLAGLPPYARNETLMEIAHWRVSDMAARGYFGHDDPATGEPACRSRATQAGFSRAGENIFGSTTDLSLLPIEAVGWYMTDAPHRNNILHPVYTSIGVGIARRGESWISAMCLGG